ncbi:MAG TPA: c-type cytochrome [Usitatibacter sp.]|nr:c-type cytochrome [Usitatibacter sp.]
MNKMPLAFALALLAAGCASTERSRALNDPAVPAPVIAEQVCSNCHGIDGNSVSPNFPRLAAQQPAYLVEQLSGFRNHHRSDPAGFEYMWGLSRHLTDSQIKGLAAYFSAQKPTPNAPGDAALAARGAEVFKNGVPAKQIPACQSCHGPNAEGNGNFPRLAGQHADYVEKQLVVFQRTNERPEGAVMTTVAHSLTADNIAAVANYVQGLAPR